MTGRHHWYDIQLRNAAVHHHGRQRRSDIHGTSAAVATDGHRRSVLQRIHAVGPNNGRPLRCDLQGRTAAVSEPRPGEVDLPLANAWFAPIHRHVSAC